MVSTVIHVIVHRVLLEKDVKQVGYSSNQLLFFSKIASVTSVIFIELKNVNL